MDEHPKDYFVPNFGVDHDIIGSLNSLSGTEKNLGHKWVLPPLKSLLQMESTSIPACHSANFPKCVSDAETAADGKLQADMDKHPKDYFIPNFGKDEDIITTQANIKNMEAKYKGKKASLVQVG